MSPVYWCCHSNAGRAYTHDCWVQTQDQFNTEVTDEAVLFWQKSAVLLYLWQHEQVHGVIPVGGGNPSGIMPKV